MSGPDFRTARLRLSRLYVLGRRHPAAILFAWSILVQLAFLAILPPELRVNQSTDWVDYYRAVGERLLTGQGLTEPDGDLAIGAPPGYPFIVAGLLFLSNAFAISEPLVIRLFVLLTNAGSCVLLFGIGSVTFNRRIGVLAAVLWSVYPVNLWLGKQPNSEVPFIFLLFFTVLLFVKYLSNPVPSPKQMVLVGLSAGAAALVRPVAIAMVLPMLGALLPRTRYQLSSRARLVLAVAMIGGFSLAVAPWEVWVLERTGELIPLADNGPPSILVGIMDAGTNEAGVDSVALPRPVNEIASVIYTGGWREWWGQQHHLKSYDGLFDVLIPWMIEHPWAATKILAVKVVQAWYATDSGWFEREIALLHVPLVLLAIHGWRRAWRAGGVRRRYAALALLLTIYFWAITVVVMSLVRYMVPVFGILAVLVAYAVIELIPSRSGRTGGMQEVQSGQATRDRTPPERAAIG